MATIKWPSQGAAERFGSKFKYNLTDGTLDNLDKDRKGYWQPVAVPKAGTTISANIDFVGEYAYYHVRFDGNGHFDIKHVSGAGFTFPGGSGSGGFGSINNTAGSYTISNDGEITLFYDDGRKKVTPIGIEIDASGQANPNQGIFIGPQHYYTH